MDHGSRKKYFELGIGPNTKKWFLRHRCLGYKNFIPISQSNKDEDGNYICKRCRRYVPGILFVKGKANLLVYAKNYFDVNAYTRIKE